MHNIGPRIFRYVAEIKKPIILIINSKKIYEKYKDNLHDLNLPYNVFHTSPGGARNCMEIYNIIAFVITQKSEISKREYKDLSLHGIPLYYLRYDGITQFELPLYMSEETYFPLKPAENMFVINEPHEGWISVVRVFDKIFERT